MTTYTVTLTVAQDKALGVVALSQSEWIQNAVNARCNQAIDAIVENEIQRKLAAGESITGTKEDIVMAASIKSAAQREAEAVARQGA